MTRARHLVSLAIVSAGIAAAGCTQVYPVKVDAIRAPETAPRRTYHLVPADPGRDPAEPAFAGARARVDRVLELNGLVAASRPEWADMIIELDFGIGHQRFISVPATNSRESGASSVYLPDRDGNTLAESSGIQVPATSLKRVISVWEKRLSLVACENSPTGRNPDHAGPELWRVDVSVQDPTPSIDDLLPVLAEALLDSIDRDTSPSTIKYISAGTAGRSPAARAN